MTGLIFSTEYNAQTTLSGIPAMVMECVKPIAINDAMFVNPFATNAVKTAQIHSWWYQEITRIDPAQTNSDPPCVYISVVNTLSQWLFSLLTLWIRLAQGILAPMQLWYTAARHHSTILRRFKHSHPVGSGKW